MFVCMCAFDFQKKSRQGRENLGFSPPPLRHEIGRSGQGIPSLLVQNIAQLT